LAKAAGSLPQSERYVDNSVSGTTIAGANGNIDQYNRAVTSSGTIKYVMMNGGGNDCLQQNNPSGALMGADRLFQTMAMKGTEKVVYFFYPDPIGSQFANLKSCLDTLRPQMKAKCDGLTAPKCYWLDLRTAWSGHAEYTNDGIHPTAAGSKATAEAIWPVAVANCVAQ
jgi:lysophospholipase L1-like esterase